MCSGALHSSPGHCVWGAFRGHTLAINIYISIHRSPGSNELFTSRGRDSGGVVYIVAVHRVYYIIIVIILLSVYTNPAESLKTARGTRIRRLSPKRHSAQSECNYIYNIKYIHRHLTGTVFKCKRCCSQGPIPTI